MMKEFKCTKYVDYYSFNEFIIVMKIANIMEKRKCGAWEGVGKGIQEERGALRGGGRGEERRKGGIE